MSIDRLFTHYRPEERIFVRQLLDAAERASDWNAPQVMDFFDPRQAVIAGQIAYSTRLVQVTLHGGWDDAERRRGVYVPEGWPSDTVDAQIMGFRVEPIGDPSKLRHGDYLGALVGLGIKRAKLGDLVVHETGCDGVATEEMVSFITQQLSQVGSMSVSTNPIALSDLRQRSERLDVRRITVASLRLDAVVSHGFQVSRADAQSAVRSGKVQLNWRVTESVDMDVEEGDVVSLRGHGRLRVLEVTGSTKKGRLGLTVGRYV